MLSISPSEVPVNQPSTVSILVTNTGKTGGSFDINLLIDGSLIETRKVTLDASATQTITFSVTKAQIGTYNIAVGTETGTLSTVSTTSPTTPPTTTPITQPTVPPVTPVQKPASFIISNLSVTPTAVKPGDTASVSVIVTNTGNLQGSYTINLNVNGTTEDSRTISLAGGTNQTVNFSVTKSQPGSYTISVNNLSTNLFVQTQGTATTTTSTSEKPKTPTTLPFIIIWVLCGGAGIVLALFLMQRVLTPADFNVSGLVIAPPIIKPGEITTVAVTVTNIGKRTGSYKVVLKINSAVEDSKDMTLKGSSSQTVNFTVKKNNPGIYLVNIDNAIGRLVVQEPTESATPTGGIRPQNWPRPL
jgi:hypothetical protein